MKYKQQREREGRQKWGDQTQEIPSSFRRTAFTPDVLSLRARLGHPPQKKKNLVAETKEDRGVKNAGVRVYV